MNILTMQGLSTDKVITDLGKLGVVSQHEKLQQDIATLLLTQYGSVIGNPTYGSHLHEYLFELSNTALKEQIITEIERVLYNHYNFVTNVRTNMEIKEHLLHIEILYSTLNTNLSTKLEFNIPLNNQGGIDYE